MRFSVLATLSAFAFLLCGFARRSFLKSAPPVPLGDRDDQAGRHRCVHEARNVLNSLSLNIYLLDRLGKRASEDVGDSWREASAQCRRDVTQLRRLIDGLAGRGKEIHWTNDEFAAAGQRRQLPGGLIVEECLGEGSRFKSAAL
jgi:hypothetical protein